MGSTADALPLLQAASKDAPAQLRNGLDANRHAEVLAAISAPYLRRSLAAAGRASVRIRSDSMRPIVRTGAVVRLRPMVAGERLRGAIVAVDAGDRVLVHRVVADTRAGVITRGIASLRMDPPWPRERIIGVMVAAEWLRWAAAAASVAYRLRHVVVAWERKISPSRHLRMSRM